MHVPSTNDQQMDRVYEQMRNKGVIVNGKLKGGINVFSKGDALYSSRGSALDSAQTSQPPSKCMLLSSVINSTDRILAPIGDRNVRSKFIQSDNEGQICNEDVEGGLNQFLGLNAQYHEGKIDMSVPSTPCPADDISVDNSEMAVGRSNIPENDVVMNEIPADEIRSGS